ncbi:MAG: hypothetical protein AB4290_26510 [Spirulina sp.]
MAIGRIALGVAIYQSPLSGSKNSSETPVETPTISEGLVVGRGF